MHFSRTIHAASTPTPHRRRWSLVATALAGAAILVASSSSHAVVAGMPRSGDHSSDVVLGGPQAEAPSNARARVWPPTPSSVGVPDGTVLQEYKGSCTISKAGKVIKGKVVTCPTLQIKTTGVVIQNSKINGSVGVGSMDESDPEGTGKIRVTVIDSEIDSSSVPDFRPIGTSHFVVKRSYLHGSFSGAHCHNACTIKRSFVMGSSSHASGLRILRNGTLKHNTIWCKPDPATEGGGCSGNLVMYEEFGVPRDNLVKHNYFPGNVSWYSLKFNGEDDGGIRIIDNLLGKSWAGNTDDWNPKPSNVWRGNKMTNGRIARH